MFKSHRNRVSKFVSQSDGVMTVEWVVLGAFVVAVAFVILPILGDASRSVAVDIACDLDEDNAVCPSDDGS